jgi:hypothetical protein
MAAASVESGGVTSEQSRRTRSEIPPSIESNGASIRDVQGADPILLSALTGTEHA